MNGYRILVLIEIKHLSLAPYNGIALARLPWTTGPNPVEGKCALQPSLQAAARTTKGRVAAPSHWCQSDPSRRSPSRLRLPNSVILGITWLSHRNIPHAARHMALLVRQYYSSMTACAKAPVPVRQCRPNSQFVPSVVVQYVAMPACAYLCKHEESPTLQYDGALRRVSLRFLGDSPAPNVSPVSIVHPHVSYSYPNMTRDNV
ncbi:hypothetical protein SODALDRAFT_358381 [Sodiomyces alkalinus F11]|uniref:Uncharacterized protein n=1 Tax=Sodiomyces alkalinus (strain CBS 110278 / VKM F-3762 / F11) TaxID=1314773 RepID=A0A3N2PZM5_SODAK|nr:hypothetical protein SODALDRAFT_358381 [Sodiomyces alkalinus F11]ROT39957.1 hypothetical protein SODALDRAFT_358381 [Sodiomyces alkalinus F11]